MSNLDACFQCDRPNEEDGVYTSDGKYLCAHCIDIILTLEGENEC